MLGLKTRVAVNAVTAALIFCECSSSVHLFQINTEMPSFRFKHVCCNPFNKKNHSGKKEKKNLRRVSSSILEKLKILKPDDVSCTQCRIEANEMEMEDFCYKYIQTCA